MATETPARTSGPPRPVLLIVLVVAVVAYLAMNMFSGGTPVPSVTKTPPPTTAKTGEGPIDPAELDVKVEALQQPAGAMPQAERNPFRFQPRPAPPPPPSTQAAPGTPPQTGQMPPQRPAGPPPIGDTIKFIGIVDTGKERVGAFSDCKATFPGREGDIVEGRYRVVRIGVESAELEYVDGKGRTTLPLNGQACVGK